MIDTGRYPTADKMSKELLDKAITTIKFNHVFYKKVSVDDEVIQRDKLEDASFDEVDPFSEKMKGELLDMVAGTLIASEVDKNMSLHSIVSSPADASEAIIKKGLVATEDGEAEGNISGKAVIDELQSIKNELVSVSEGEGAVNITSLAMSVFEMKRNLLSGIDAYKKGGIVFNQEQDIVDEANALTDEVLMQLVREEYRKGKVTVKRLAMIIRRLIPDPAEIKRVLPKIKSALIGEGMPLSDFLKLGNTLEKELMNEDLASSVKKSAEKIGISGDELLKEFKYNPDEAAELIYLASEIKKGTGDQKALTNVLVDYVEKIGTKVTMDSSKNEDMKGTDHLRAVVSAVEKQLVSHLENKEVASDILEDVIRKLDVRLDDAVKAIKSQWIKKRLRNEGETTDTKKSVLDILEESTSENDEFREVLKDARHTISKKGIDKDNFKEVLEEINRVKKEHEAKASVNSLPKGTYNKNNIVFFAEKELLRSARYKTPFAVIVFSLMKIAPKKKVNPDQIKQLLVMYNIMATAYDQVRETDMVGLLDTSKIIILLPMTDGNEAHLTMRRLMKVINTEIYRVNDVFMDVKMAGAVTIYDHQTTPEIKSFIESAETRAQTMVQRIRNVQSLY